MKAMDWIHANVHPNGGIRAWRGGQQYPEVTGYLIPTLLHYGEDDLARQFADWLLTVQNADGSFNGLDGVPRTFDTATCYEGLRAAFQKFSNHHYLTASGKALKWLKGMQECGVFWTSGDRNECNDYTIRANGLAGIHREMPESLWPNRVHYAAYALEGALMLGEVDFVREQLEYLQPFIVNGMAPYEIRDGCGLGMDLCATVQLGILFIKFGYGDLGTVAALEVDNYPNSWTAKYHLDLLAIHEHEIVRH